MSFKLSMFYFLHLLCILTLLSVQMSLQSLSWQDENWHRERVEEGRGVTFATNTFFPIIYDSVVPIRSKVLQNSSHGEASRTQWPFQSQTNSIYVLLRNWIGRIKIYELYEQGRKLFPAKTPSQRLYYLNILLILAS